MLLHCSFYPPYWDQMELPWYKALAMDEVRSVPVIQVNDSEEKLSVSGKDFEYIFSKKTGQLTSVKYKGKELIREGARLSVWRAPLANDLDNWATWGANLMPRKPDMGTFPAGSWYTYRLDQLNFKLDRFTVKYQDPGRVSIEINDHAEGADYTTAFDNHYLYSIDGTGELTIDHTVTPQGKMPLWLPKIGLQWIMDNSLDRVTWYGRGPFETYPDRKTGAKIDVYSKTVQEMAESYLVPQDYGCRTDNRWVRVETADGTGLQFSGSNLFNFSAQLHSTDNMSRARYPYQLQPMEGYTFNFDYATSGVGCTAISVLDKYRVVPQEYHYIMQVKPYRK